MTERAPTSERSSALCGSMAASVARDAVVALRNAEHLAKSPRVAAATIVGLLPELRASIACLDAFVRECMLREPGSACPDGTASADALARVGAALEAMTRGEGASARLSLERVLAAELPRIGACVDVCDHWYRAALPRRVELSLGDVVCAALEPCGEGTPGAVRVSISPDPVTILADPQVSVWLLRAVLAAYGPTASLEARGAGDGATIVLSQRPLAEGTWMARPSVGPSSASPVAIERIAARAGWVVRTLGETIALEIPRAAVAPRAPIA